MHQIQRYEVQETSFITLLDKALYANMISKERYLEIQKQIEHKVSSLVKEYNRGRSSSISITLYQKFLKSVLFTLDHALEKSAQITIFALSIEEAYAKGHAVIETIVDEIEDHYLSLKQRMWPFMNERYCSIFDQITSFLARYDTTFFAYRCIEDLDYPLLDGIPLQHHMYHKKGCDLVCEYVKRLRIEDQFIQRFHEEIPQLISAYEDTKGIAVTWLGCSLCEIVFHQYLFHLFTSHTSLLFDVNLHAFLCKRIYALRIDEIWKYVDDKMKQDISYEEYSYLCKGKDNFLKQVEIAKQAQEVEHFILCNGNEKRAQFQLKAPCDPKIYRALLQALNKQEDALQKATQILQADLGFYDYIDLFEAEILQEEDYIELFTRMQDIQLMSLLAYLAQDIMSFHQHITLSKKQLEKLPKEYEWQRMLYVFFVSLSPSQKHRILDLLERVVISFS